MEKDKLLKKTIKQLLLDALGDDTNFIVSGNDDYMRESAGFLTISKENYDSKMWEIILEAGKEIEKENNESK